MSTSNEPNGADEAGTTTHQPYVPDNVKMPELTWSALLLGTALGLIFSASSIYLVLKIGMTVSASIPVAVLAITLFRGFSRTFGFRQTTILENNVVQTAGSAGESIAFGVGVTMPALLILGFEMDVGRVMVVSVLGGLLGILAMIPLRRAFIVKMHGKPGQPGTLLYPEGTACAQVLISGEKGGTTGKTVFIGFFIAFLHKVVSEGMNLMIATFKLPLKFLNKSAAFTGDMASEMIGVGYIIGLRTAAVMMGGALLGYLVLIPLIAFAGESGDMPVKPGKKLISEMDTKELRDNYLLYIGAGCVAAAGIISMIRTLPMLVRSIRSGLQTVRAGGGAQSGVVRRTEDDMSMRVVLFGSLGLIVLLAIFLTTQVGLIAAVAGALMVVLFGFLFVTVSARLTGEIGSSSNPISGMTVATLTMTCLIFWGLGWTSSIDRVLALSIAAVVCVAASNGGTTAQSLKTGYIVGGTPRAMQLAILFGAIVSALVIGYTLLEFNKAGTVYSKKSDNLPSIILTKGELKQIKERKTYEEEEYIVWDSRRNYEFEYDTKKEKVERQRELEDVTEARYLIDPYSGEPRWRVDDAIMGKLRERDNGERVNRDFEAPKTQVMGIIINGVLKGELKWDLILMGATIAVMLELCGVSALAFAVGVYVPISVSTPIFLGGLVRWSVDSYNARKNQPTAAEGDDPEARARAEVEAIRKSETSPGVLLAAGYIAGGSLAGMLITFTNLSPELPKKLSTWQYSKYVLEEERPFKKVAEELGRERLGLGKGSLDKEEQAKLDAFVEEMEELNKGTLEKYAPIKEGSRVKLPDKTIYTVPKDTTLGELAKDKFDDEDKISALLDENKKALVPEVVVSPDTTLRRPKDYSKYTYKGEKPITLAELARLLEGKAEKASDYYEKNSKTLSLPEQNKEGVVRIKAAETLPKDTELKLPQRTWPALFFFALLIGFLALVGMGKLLASPEEENGMEKTQS